MKSAESPASWHPGSDVAQQRGWGGGSWGGRRHHDDGIDAGDIIAGLLIFGTIAAVASAAGKSNNDRETRDRDYRGRYPREDAPRYNDRNYGRYDDRNDSRSYGANSRGLDSAVDNCVSEVERGNRTVDTVDSVDRDANGWRVEGRVSGGASFACSVSTGGEIRSVTVDGRAL